MTCPAWKFCTFCNCFKPKHESEQRWNFNLWNSLHFYRMCNLTTNSTPKGKSQMQITWNSALFNEFAKDRIPVGFHGCMEVVFHVTGMVYLFLSRNMGSPHKKRLWGSDMFVKGNRYTKLVYLLQIHTKKQNEHCPDKWASRKTNNPPSGGINIDIVEARPCGKPRHRAHRPNQGKNKSGSNARSYVPDW